MLSYSAVNFVLKSEKRLNSILKHLDIAYNLRLFVIVNNLPWKKRLIQLIPQ